MSPVTIFLAKTLGIFCIIVAIGMIARRKAVLPAVDGMLTNGPLLFVVGVFTIGIGLAMVVGHNLWHGGAATIVVTILGWLSLLKGIALAFTPPARMAQFYRGMDYERRLPLLMGVSLLLGLYLTAVGFGAI